MLASRKVQILRPMRKLLCANPHTHKCPNSSRGTGFGSRISWTSQQRKTSAPRERKSTGVLGSTPVLKVSAPRSTGTAIGVGLGRAVLDSIQGHTTLCVRPTIETSPHRTKTWPCDKSTKTGPERHRSRAPILFSQWPQWRGSKRKFRETRKEERQRSGVF